MKYFPSETLWGHLQFKLETHKSKYLQQKFLLGRQRWKYETHKWKIHENSWYFLILLMSFVNKGLHGPASIFKNIWENISIILYEYDIIILVIFIINIIILWNIILFSSKFSSQSKDDLCILECMIRYFPPTILPWGGSKSSYKNFWITWFWSLDMGSFESKWSEVCEYRKNNFWNLNFVTKSPKTSHEVEISLSNWKIVLCVNYGTKSFEF